MATIADLSNTPEPEDQDPTTGPSFNFDHKKEVQLARLSPAGFAMYASRGEWTLAPHLAYLNEVLLDMAQRKITRLIISMPPRHGKSEFVSRYLPAWIIGALKERVILTSYEAKFAAEWGGKARDLIHEFGDEVFNCKLRHNFLSDSHWETTDGGKMYTSGVGGPLTGKGCDWLIIDDPIKNAEEAQSAIERENADNWYRSTAFTRLEPRGVVIMMMTRWHEDDLVGRRLKEEADKWTVINFPAIAMEDDVLGRKTGDALWPARFGLKDLEEKRASQGLKWWFAMYQQSPTIEGGDKIQMEWWQEYDELPESWDRIVVSWDTAWGTKDYDAFSVAAVWMATKNGYYLLEVKRKRVEYPDLVDWAHDFSARYPGCLHLIEDAASGKALAATLQRETRYPVRPVKVQNDKVSRLNEVIVNIEEGRCFLPKYAPWKADFIEEHQRFPGTTHKDQVDTTSLVLAYFARLYRHDKGKGSTIGTGLKENHWSLTSDNPMRDWYDYNK